MDLRTDALGNQEATLSFPYDKGDIDFVAQIPSRAFNWDDRSWHIPCTPRSADLIRTFIGRFDREQTVVSSAAAEWLGIDVRPAAPASTMTEENPGPAPTLEEDLHERRVRLDRRAAAASDAAAAGRREALDSFASCYPDLSEMACYVSRHVPMTGTATTLRLHRSWRGKASLRYRNERGCRITTSLRQYALVVHPDGRWSWYQLMNHSDAWLFAEAFAGAFRDAIPPVPPKALDDLREAIAALTSSKTARSGPSGRPSSGGSARCT